MKSLSNVKIPPPARAILMMAVIAMFTMCADTTSSDHDKSGGKKPQPISQGKLFEMVSADRSGIHFENKVVEDQKYNFLDYEYYSSGGGVAVGDINNDKLPDIYFVSNQGPNQLYLNKGNFKFKNITAQAGVSSAKGWSSGAAMVDINDDGFLDIYLSRGGNEERPEDRQNQLFINNGDLTFTEMAADYGLNDMGRTTQAAFLDFDRDGDLDVYILNHHNEFGIDNETVRQYHQTPPAYASDRLLRNDGSSGFRDVTLQAGLQNFGFGLGVGIGDLNSDGWPDIFVANDYTQNDFYYLNNHHGSFVDYSKFGFGHMSLFAMGVDIADVNNDGLLDIYEVEMLPDDYYRSKVNMRAMDIEGYYRMLQNGFHYQYMHNALHINTGPGFFSEIGQLAGVAKTDWSWGTLLLDADNDGMKDILVTNGVLHDYKNRDFVAKANLIAAEKENQALSLSELHKMVPRTPLPNYAFRNKNGYQFTDVSKDWGFDYAGYSSGLAYGDFDNDGDFDFVIGNMNSTSFVYRNLASEQGQNFVKLKFKGPSGNRFGIGTKVRCKTGKNEQYQELYTVRGFQSGSEPVMIFGLGEQTTVAEIKVEWPDGKWQVLESIRSGKTLIIDHKEANNLPEQPEAPNYLFRDVAAEFGLDFRHSETGYNDFEKEILLPHKYSQNGPCLAVADVNSDGLEDFYLGGAAGQPGALFIQSASGRFTKSSETTLERDSRHEDTGALFFDANGDGAVDLYVVSGSNEKPEGSDFYRDRLYLNNGKGEFRRSDNMLPDFRISGSCATASDFDKDGDLDVFVGGRVVPGNYPFPAESVLLVNEGSKFRKASDMPWLAKMGMVTDAVWVDYDNDKDDDLIVAGEWMPVRLFRNENGKLTEATAESGLEGTEGWWQSLGVEDIDGDGDLDVFAGNVGLNHKLAPKKGKSVHVYANDFDNNRTTDIVLAKPVFGELKPVRGKDCTSEQMPFINEKFQTFAEFANADLGDILGPSLADALHLEAHTFASTLFVNDGGRFVTEELPLEAQFSAVQGFVFLDIEDDGKKEVFIAGNLAETEVETTRLDGSKGLILSRENGEWSVLHPRQTGILAGGNVKDMQLLITGEQNLPVILIGNNNGQLLAYGLNKQVN